MVAAAPQVYSLSKLPDGTHKATINLHAGQSDAYRAERRFVLVLAGTQSGKTTVGPMWLFREMQRRGPGDYLIASPTFPLMEIKVVPEFKRLFANMGNMGDYVASPIRKFTLNRRGNQTLFGNPDPGEETHIYFGYGSDPDSLESATYKAAWLDEAGQKKFRLASWEAILRRLSIAQGRVLLTTTPYTLGWLKTELHDKAGDPDSDIALVNFPSIANPLFTKAEWERAKRTLPAWKFNMFYRGVFDRPPGLIYDCFDPARHLIPRFAIPEEWERFLGLDFGGVNTAGIFFAKERNAEGKPTKRYIGYREYHAGGRTSKEHAAELRKGEPRTPTAIGGSKSEGQWRQEFAQGGLSVGPPVIADVEVGINRFYAALAETEPGEAIDILFFDDLAGTIEQLNTYSRELDDRGEPTERIEDKETYHFLDAGRYIVSYLQAGMDGQAFF